MPSVVVTAKGENRIRGGHPWVYRSDVADVRDVEPGVVVEVHGPRQRLLGHALFSDQSQITIRMLTRDEIPIDERSEERRVGNERISGLSELPRTRRTQ